MLVNRLCCVSAVVVGQTLCKMNSKEACLAKCRAQSVRFVFCAILVLVHVAKMVKNGHYSNCHSVAKEVVQLELASNS